MRYLIKDRIVDRSLSPTPTGAKWCHLANVPSLDWTAFTWKWSCVCVCRFVLVMWCFLTISPSLTFKYTPVFFFSFIRLDHQHGLILLRPWITYIAVYPTWIKLHVFSCEYVKGTTASDHCYTSFSLYTPPFWPMRCIKFWNSLLQSSPCCQFRPHQQLKCGCPPLSMTLGRRLALALGASHVRSERQLRDQAADFQSSVAPQLKTEFDLERRMWAVG